eukprot:CAMPEP_0195533874 /NCGR_PEP_ID=MMETSP0794_2-20130614/41369_1 /TAXON_ID=515487 /ORGANISM="Stephanopyxis turris, Strain CCMP 815" /LENGTH=55 /DNA_ID=CAMNT_0040666541 /DNA_START=295 /DNA_END=462 /DNA_ORIENTATION=-
MAGETKNLTFEGGDSDGASDGNCVGETVGKAVGDSETGAVVVGDDVVGNSDGGSS